MNFRNTQRIILLIIFTGCSFLIQAQPFAAEIEAFKKQDSIQPPPPNLILFVGSSSFTKWTDVQDYFPKKRIINRGFGGSTLTDVIRYANDIILPYHPKQIIIYCGENDFASSNNVTVEMVVQRFHQLYDIIRTALPKVSIVYVAMKPSPSRRHLMIKQMVANGEIRDFLEFEPNGTFLDVYYPMLLKDGSPNGALFTSDSLHMNAVGYKLWKELLDPFIMRAK